MASAGRPLTIRWESDTSGVREGAEDVVRSVEDTAARVDQVEQQAAQRRVSRGEEVATSLRDMWGINTAQEFAQMAEQVAQAYADAFVSAMEAQADRIKTARDAAFGIYSEGGAPTPEDELKARVTALGNGDFTAGLLEMQRRGLSAQDLLGAGQNAGLPASVAGAAADVGSSGFVQGLLGTMPAVGALAWLTGRAAESSGMAGDARVAAAVQGQREALQAAQIQTELLRQIAANTGGGGGPVPAPGVNGEAPSASPAWTGAGAVAFVTGG